MTKLTWLGHSTWLIEVEGQRVILDPFLSDNPSATAKPEQFDDCDFVLISHGHFDHVADASQIASRSDATVVAIYEIAEWFNKKQQVQNTVGMNIGGEVNLPFGTIKMVPALHSNSLPDGSPAGLAAGYLITDLSGQRLYFACDTAFFGDMVHYAKNVDVAVLPIGDLFTMGIKDSIRTIQAISPKKVLPTHYNTWPPIEVDVQAWSDEVKADTNAEPIVLQVNESIEL